MIGEYEDCAKAPSGTSSVGGGKSLEDEEDYAKPQLEKSDQLSFTSNQTVS